jgi:uncharacterized protein with PIN domain
MSELTFRFYGDLNDFLPPARRQVDFPCAFRGPQSVKHLIEALGVPHPEVAAILIDGQPAGFDHLPRPGVRVAVYPLFRALELDGLPPLRPPLPDPPAFLADNHLGRLARALRLLGFDTTYDAALDDEGLAELAAGEGRVLLTRDRGLLKRRLVVWGYCLRTTDSREQLFAVVRRFDLAGRVDPWRRCLRCNGLLQPVEKAAILDRLEPKTRLYYDDFQQCADCRQIYWRGSHFDDLERLVSAITGGAEEEMVHG